MTQEDKEVLIRFMGCTIVKSNSRYSTDPAYKGECWTPYGVKKKSYHSGSTPKKVMRSMCNKSEYHRDWNWVMGVYEKIVDWCDDNNVTDYVGITEALCNPDIEEMCEQMVAWIKAYEEELKEIEDADNR